METGHSGVELTVTDSDHLMAPPSSSVVTSPDFLSPHCFNTRHSLCSVPGDYSPRRRRPLTLRIGPRLSLPGKSTSAPASTDGDWPDISPLDVSGYNSAPVLVESGATNKRHGGKGPCVLSRRSKARRQSSWLALSVRRDARRRSAGFTRMRAT
uniref:Uncharacterized protein n=1 Tax=Timema cristinae TaxID=61476 RepID=A0A7R9DPG3_TIMCR|nr:unnamed protein product [Timema cristinae]